MSLLLRNGLVLMIATLFFGATPHLCLVCRAADPPEGKAESVRVGLFDSRAVATAYYRSAKFRDKLTKLTKERDDAKAAGDDKKVAALEAQGQKLQSLAHRQGFSTAPIPNVLAELTTDLKTIAEGAKVEMIVNRWEVAYRADKATFVDVTDALVADFHPDEATKRLIRELIAKPPVAEEDLR